MEKLFKIHPDDNVYVVRQAIPAGETFIMEGRPIKAVVALGLGHKIAACDLAQGQRVYKFGVPIGSASTPIAAGEHVHLHNLKSDYIPTYTLDHEFIKP